MNVKNIVRRAKARPVVRERLRDENGQYATVFGERTDITIGNCQRKLLETTLFNHLLTVDEETNESLLDEVIRRVRHDKPEKILDLASRMLPKEIVQADAGRTIAPVIIQINEATNIKIAPPTENVVEGAIVD